MILVEGDLKPPFSVATIQRYKGGWSSITWIAPLYPWPYLIAPSKAASSTIFLVFGMTRPGIELCSPGPLASTLLIRPMAGTVKLATVVEGDQKTHFSIDTTPRCRGGRYSFPWIDQLYPWSLSYNAEY